MKSTNVMHLLIKGGRDGMLQVLCGAALTVEDHKARTIRHDNLRTFKRGDGRLACDYAPVTCPDCGEMLLKAGFEWAGKTPPRAMFKSEPNDPFRLLDDE